MEIKKVLIKDFRCLDELSLSPSHNGLTLLTGENGTGKTSVLEAISYLLTRSSFRGADSATMVRIGTAEAVLRSELSIGGREVLVEATLASSGRDRFLLNRLPVRSQRQLPPELSVTVCASWDSMIISGSPAERRQYLDGLASGLYLRYNEDRRSLDRILKQRASLLQHIGKRLDPSLIRTLDVFDEQLASIGEAIRKARYRVITDLTEPLNSYYTAVSGNIDNIGAYYFSSWKEDLLTALKHSRQKDIQRGVTTVGPHRDDLVLEISGRSARGHASQGEQRSLAIALKLAAHRLVGERVGSEPALLLDDVLADLDERRSARLIESLPKGQVLLAASTPLPKNITPDRVIVFPGDKHGL